MRPRRVMRHGAAAATRAEGGECRLRDGGRGAMTGVRHRLPQRADDQTAHEVGVAETHFCLGRMDVDVDRLRRPIEEESHHRMTIAREEILIRTAHRASQELVAYRAAIDEEILV